MNTIIYKLTAEQLTKFNKISNKYTVHIIRNRHDELHWRVIVNSIPQHEKDFTTFIDKLATAGF
jgi:hypothetical protein